MSVRAQPPADQVTWRFDASASLCVGFPGALVGFGYIGGCADKEAGAEGAKLSWYRGLGVTTLVPTASQTWSNNPKLAGRGWGVQYGGLGFGDSPQLGRHLRLNIPFAPGFLASERGDVGLSAVPLSWSIGALFGFADAPFAELAALAQSLPSALGYVFSCVATAEPTVGLGVTVTARCPATTALVSGLLASSARAFESAHEQPFPGP